MLWLLDTGPLVAFLDERDGSHERTRRAFRWMLANADFVTTMPVVTEAMYLLRNVPGARASLAGLLVSSRGLIYPSHRECDLFGAVRLMERYADTPMDYADASLVHLSSLAGTRKVFTLDERGFRIFQPGSRIHFDLVLDQF
jgi:uncharacterized protein